MHQLSQAYLALGSSRISIRLNSVTFAISDFALQGALLCFCAAIGLQVGAILYSCLGCKMR